MQLPPEAWLRTATFNCGITWITGALTARPAPFPRTLPLTALLSLPIAVRAGGGVSLWGFGDVGHLPYDMVSYG